jgi:K+-sensing histidine kinase KdpD
LRTKGFVAQITRVIVRETVPDAFIEKADEIELVDIPQLCIFYLHFV